ncbi:MAG: hypothetical protein ACLFQJ_02470 [Campylobacterales bacterium]
MIKILKKVSLQDGILGIKATTNGCIVLDSSYKLYKFKLPDISLSGQTKLLKTFEPPHKHANNFSISKNALISLPLLGTEKSVLIKISPKIEKLMVNTWHDGDVESSAFSKDGSLLATGGTDGKVFVFDVKRTKLLFSLPPRGEYISNITFSSSGEFVVASSYDKFTVIYSTLQNKVKDVFKQHDVVERASFFDNDTKLYLVSRNGRSIIYDLIKKSTISNESHFAKWPSTVCITECEQYALVGTRGNIFYLIRLEDNAKMLDLKFDYMGFSALSNFKTTIMMGFTEGTFLVVDYNNGEDDLKEAIDKLDFKEARKIIEENVFLTIHPATKAFDEHWDEYLQKAIKLLNDNKTEEAIEVVDPFLFDPKKKKDFDFYLMQKGPVKQFMDAINAKEYAKAYEMVSLNKFLMKTSAYDELERHWAKAFATAKKLLEEDPTLNRKKVEMVFKPFENTCKKDLIFQLLKNTNVFIQADEYIKKQKFKEYFALTEKFFFLKETDLYEKVSNFGQKLLDQFGELEKAQQFEEAEELAKKIMIFPMYKKSIAERINSIKSKAAFIEAVEKGNNDLAFKLVEKNESLKGLPQFKELQARFEPQFEQAKVQAFNGEPKRVLLELKGIKEIDFWREKIGSLMKIAYLNEINNFIKDDDVNWDLTLKRYIKRFSKDSEIRKIMSDAGKISLLDDIDDNGSSEGYKNSEFVDYIVVHKGES